MLAWALFLLLSSPPARAQGLTALSAPPVLTTAYDTDAFLVPLSQAASLQELLDKHGSVRLLPGDYVPTCTTTRTGRQPPVTNCSFPPANLTVRTGQRIWGLPGAKVPGAVIEPGAQGVVLGQPGRATRTAQH